MNRLLSLLLWFPVALSALLSAGPAQAQAQAQTGGNYKPYVPDAGEQVSAPLFVVLAYSLIWLLVLLFVFSIWRRQRRVNAELEQLQRQLRG